MMWHNNMDKSTIDKCCLPQKTNDGNMMMKGHRKRAEKVGKPFIIPWKVGKPFIIPPKVARENLKACKKRFSCSSLTRRVIALPWEASPRSLVSPHGIINGFPTLIASLLILILCSIILLFPTSHASAHLIATGNGRISGQLLDGSRKNTPLAGQTVTLQISQDGSARDLTTSKTNPHGTYTFTNLATDQAISYALYINYQGAQYTSDIVMLTHKSLQQTNLIVYDATASTSNIAIIQSTVLVHAPDAKKSTFTVSELFDFKNFSLQTFVGSLDTSLGKPNALYFSLPKDARSISLDQGFTGYKVSPETGGFATNAAVYPGDTAFSLSFEVPYLSSIYDFAYKALYPTVSLSFMVDPSIHASATALNSQRIVTVQQHPYRVFAGSKFLTDQEIHVNFEGLPHPSSSVSTIDLKTIWLIVGFLLLLAIITVASALSRLKDGKDRRRKGNRHTSKNDHNNHHNNHNEYEHTHKKAASTTKERKEALMHELLELDKEFEAGKLSKATYQERRARTKAHLRTLLSDQEASHR